MYNCNFRRNLLNNIKPKIDINNYLTVLTLEDNTYISKSYSVGTLYYCINGDGVWKVSSAADPIIVPKGTFVSFKLTISSSTGSTARFEIDKKYNLLGNCMSILFGDNAKNKKSLLGYKLCFYYMFRDATKIVSVSDNFLPATTLDELCYSYMFKDCNYLVKAPNLPATTLAYSCYNYMFYYCSSLTTAPVLPATTLVDSCYDYMFYGCRNLNYIQSNNTAWSSDYSLNWVGSVASIGTFIKNPTASVTRGSHAIPTIWNVSDIPLDFDNSNTVMILALEDSFLLKLSDNNILYCTSEGTWKTLTANTYTPEILDGEFIYLKSLGLVPSESNGIGNFTFTKKCKVGGNCMSLIDGDTTTLECGKYSFKNLFKNCTTLVSVSPTFLPATKISESCYESMFENCINLKNSPNLPAASGLAKNCYKQMFKNCKSMTTAPELYSKTAEYCYDSMFYGCESLVLPAIMPKFLTSAYCCKNMYSYCTKLIKAVELQNNSLSVGCFYEMYKGCSLLNDAYISNVKSLIPEYSYFGIFLDCTSLETPPDLIGLSLDKYCYCNMFKGCISLKTLPVISATFINEGCFKSMFEDCSELSENTVTLPYTILYSDCYNSMFKNCVNLLNAPELPAPNLVEGCYFQMFYNCKNINYINAKFNTEPLDIYTNDWLYGTSETGTFIKNINATWNNRGSSSIPITWNIEHLVNIHDYLTIEALENGLTVKLSTNAIEYCIDGDGNWINLESGVASTSINIGLTISIRANLIPSDTGIGTFTVSKKFNLLGNCMSILFKDDTSQHTSLEGFNYAFYNLFKSSTKLQKISDGFLPALLLSDYCYLGMFYGCTALTNTPELPAVNIANYCYAEMFYGCSLLTSVVKELPAVELYDHCYYRMFMGCSKLTEIPKLNSSNSALYCYAAMFRNCTSLTTASQLPATTLQDYCYSYMFYGCTALTTPPELPATTLANYCYEYMFRGCTSLTTPPELPATTLANYCYRYMFYGCSVLSKAPILPARTLVSLCYNYMFYQCPLISYIKALFITKPTTSYSSNWLNGVSSSGKFISNSKATWSVTGVTGVPSGWTKEGHLDNYIIIQANEDELTVKLSTNSCEYCIGDDDSIWHSLPADTETLSIAQNEIISFRGNISPTSATGVGTFTVSKKFNLKGNGLGLLYGSNSLSKTTAGSSSLRYLFKNCTTLVSVSPTFLPATKVGSYAYSLMFYGCTALTKAPDLPAVTLASNCYNSMFYGCTKLAKAPNLNADVLVNYCYRYMFLGCSKLNSIQMLGTTIPATTCFTSWVDGVASTGTFVKHSSVTLETGVSGIPSGWTVTNYSS